jgi:protein-tyrosine phosphatase
MIAQSRSNADLGPGAAAGAPSLIRRREKFVDVHCHCLPNVDDGPRSLEESIALCRALIEDNIGLVVATPHQLGRFETDTDAERIGEGVRRLNCELSGRGMDLTVLAGAEVRLDERIGPLLADGKILTLADQGRYILLELPSDVFIDIEPVLHTLAAVGVTAILAHPERNAPLLRHLQTLSRWLECGAHLQLTAASIAGAFGSRAEAAAWELLDRGWVEIVASDAHDTGANRPYMKEAFARIAGQFDRQLARLLCRENPSRVVNGHRLVPACSRAGQEAR